MDLFHSKYYDPQTLRRILHYQGMRFEVGDIVAEQFTAGYLIYRHYYKIVKAKQGKYWLRAWVWDETREKWKAGRNAKGNLVQFMVRPKYAVNGVYFEKRLTTLIKRPIVHMKLDKNWRFQISCRYTKPFKYGIDRISLRRIQRITLDYDSSGRLFIVAVVF